MYIDNYCCCPFKSSSWIVFPLQRAYLQLKSLSRVCVIIVFFSSYTVFLCVLLLVIS